MTAPINIYFIWYGGGASGFTEAQKNIFRDITTSFSSGGDAANTGEGKCPCICCKHNHIGLCIFNISSPCTNERSFRIQEPAFIVFALQGQTGQEVLKSDLKAFPQYLRKS
jgi:hypothetical protein